MVEPVQGALRFVPAFLNAAVGDTLQFIVVNGQHSVVQSSAISPCNATAGGFNSGVEQAHQQFSQVVSTTDPLFFFSDVAGDCQSGLFGAVNANTGLENSNTTVAAMMPQWAAANPDIGAALLTVNKIANQTGGLIWGDSFDAAQIPTELHVQLAENVLYTRAVIGSNPEMVGPNGVFTMTGGVIVPNDVSALFNVADQGGYPAPAAANDAASDPAPTDSTTGGAGSLVAAPVAVAGLAVLAAFLML